MSAKKDDQIIQPYLFFNGRCEEALEFYRKAIGAEVEFMMRYKECPEPTQPGQIPPGFAEKIMHTTFRIGQNHLMASDGNSLETAAFAGFSLSISVTTESEAEKIFAALAEGGTVKMPMAKTFWSPRFGMLQDRFGVGWMVSVPGPMSS